MTQLSEENFQEENSELYFCFYYGFAGDGLQKHIIQANGTDNNFKVHWLLIWKVFLLQSFDLERSIVTIINTWELLHLPLKEPATKQHASESLAPLTLLSFAAVSFSQELHLYVNIQWHVQWGNRDIIELQLKYTPRKRVDRRDSGALSLMCLALFWILVWTQYMIFSPHIYFISISISRHLSLYQTIGPSYLYTSPERNLR